LNNCGQVFRYAIANERAERDISTDLYGSWPTEHGEFFWLVFADFATAFITLINDITATQMVCALSAFS
jgi:hypothetical protein